MASAAHSLPNIQPKPWHFAETIAAAQGWLYDLRPRLSNGHAALAEVVGPCSCHTL